tara:strand:+ start:2278 stop:2949 length:672 start_codon:yes stop_codon:yes gene_type:complete
MNNKIKKKSPAKFIGTLTAMQSIGLIAGVGGAIFGKGNKGDKRKLSDAEARFDKRLSDYENLNFQPIDPNIIDQENIFEDMEVDTTAFEMQRKAFAQQQANILQGLKGVAGGSGAASLAQALSTQAEMATQQMGTTVGQMMARNRELRLQEESRINQAMTQVELANAEGARQFELDQLTTLLGVEGQRVAGARANIAGRRQMFGQLAAGLGSMAGGYLSGLGD